MMPKHNSIKSCGSEAILFPHKLLTKIFLQPPVYLLLLVLVFFSSNLSEIHAETITPDKVITIVSKDSKDPLWKQWWDSARKLTREQKYPEAIEKYQRILQEKPHVEEVKWELCKVLIATENYKPAAVLLESLLETDGTRTDYLISAGDMALINGRNDQATLYFGQALELDPGGDRAIESLQGLISSLRVQGKNKLAIPLMEQLYQRGAVTPELLLDLGRLTRDVDNFSKSSHYYTELVTKYRVESEIVLETAEVLERVEKIDEAAILWEKYLKNKPYYLIFRKKLVEYLLLREKYTEILPHLQILIEHGTNRAQYLLVAGRILLHNLGRADKALSYFEQYAREFPEGRDVSSEISKIQLILANDLLSIVENDGAWMLWRDLARLTPDRIGIYRAMAELLAGLDKEEELIEVLQIIIVHDREDLDTVIQLSTLYLKNELYGECISSLGSAKNKQNLTAAYYLLRSQCEKGIKDDLKRLKSYLSYLDLIPSDDTIRMEAIRLAGDTGLVKQLQKLYSDYQSSQITDTQNAYEISISYIDELLKNQPLPSCRTALTDAGSARNVCFEISCLLCLFHRMQLYFHHEEARSMPISHLFLPGRNQLKQV